MIGYLISYDWDFVNRNWSRQKWFLSHKWIPITGRYKWEIAADYEHTMSQLKKEPYWITTTTNIALGEWEAKINIFAIAVKVIDL